MSDNLENKTISDKKKAYEELKANRLKNQKPQKSQLMTVIKGYMPSVLNWVFFFAAVIVLALGALILTGALQIKSTAPIIGSIPKVFAWILVVIGSLTVIYAIYPIFLPAIPEIRKIKWLKGKKYLGNIVRVFTSLILFASLFLLYDTFITEILQRLLG